MKNAIFGKPQILETAEDFNRLPEPEKQASYGELVERLVRKRYSQSQVEAIINNYLDDSENEQYKSEFLEMQAYRKSCKAYAKTILND
jgi:predicted CopG family antitoxin